MATPYSEQPARSERITTGVPGLDQILNGGLIPGGIYAVTGEPGAGKTILGSQMCFHRVAQGERVVYVTLLSETHTRMFVHLQSLRFFDRELIGDALQYFSAYQVFDQEGFGGLLSFLREVIRDQRASLLVIDGLGSVEVAASAAVEHLAFKRFINHVQALSEMSRCTTLLLMHVREDPAGLNRTMVDGVITLQTQLVGLRMVREMHVPKFRGSSHLMGRHFYNITDAGVVIYPRIEALYARPSRVSASQPGRLGTGVAGLDALLRGGLRANSTTMIFGPTGSGKTLFGLHFLAAGAQAGEPGLHLGFYEPQPELIEKGEQVGLNMRGMLESGALELIWQPPVEQLIDEVAQRLLDAVDRRGVRRLILDGFEAFKAQAVYPERLSRFMSALLNELSARQVTTIFSTELRDLINPIVSIDVDGISALVDNMIFIRQVEIGSRLARVISIMKTRASHHDPTIRSFIISDEGISIGAATDDTGEALSGSTPTPE
ncbi:MAG: AAA family ATPase [Chloroflexales bacterium]|nr:AAA family ATPase [Chloroflexales bacterium]